MSSYIQNYGFTKSYIQDDNKHNIKEIKWNGNYDGNIANIDLNINDNGLREFVSMKLTNEDLSDIFGIQPIDMSIEKRLLNDFPIKYEPMLLEGALMKKSRKHKKRKYKRRKSRKY